MHACMHSYSLLLGNNEDARKKEGEREIPAHFHVLSREYVDKKSLLANYNANGFLGRLCMKYTTGNSLSAIPSHIASYIPHTSSKIRMALTRSHAVS